MDNLDDLDGWFVVDNFDIVVIVVVFATTLVLTPSVIDCLGRGCESS